MNYDNTGEKPTIVQLNAQLRKHIPTTTKRLALQSHKKDKSANNVVSAHRVLDVVGIERVESALGDGVPLNHICHTMKLTKGQFWSWVHSDDERTRRVEKAQFAKMQDARITLYEDVINAQVGDEPMDNDERELIKLKLKAADSIGEVLSRPDPKKAEEGGIKVNIDFGSLLGQ